MTTATVAECNSPVSLRTCGSSNSSLLNRKRLQTKCISPNKRSYLSRQASFGIIDLRLEVTLTASPVSSPIPRSTMLLCDGRESDSPISKSQSTTPVRLKDCEFADKEISRTKSAIAPDFCVVGSKPRLHGMWDVEDRSQATKRVQKSDLLDSVEDRTLSHSPDNPPPSPINFLPSLEGVVVGGQRLICPERLEQGQQSYSRDFNPGFVKQPQHHCVKCEGRVIEEELTRVTLHKRLSSIMDRHTSIQYVPYQNEDDTCKEHQSTQQIRLSEHVDMCRSSLQLHAEKKRLKMEKDRLKKKRREIRMEGKRIVNLTKLKENIQRKEQRSQELLDEYYVMRNIKFNTKNVEKSNDSPNAKHDNANLCDKVTPSSNTDLHLPPISKKGSKSKTSNSPENKKSDSFQLPVGALKPCTDEAKKEEIPPDLQRSRSDTVTNIDNNATISAEKSLTDTEADKISKVNTKNAIHIEQSKPLDLSPRQQGRENDTTITCFDSSTTLNPTKNVCVSVSTEENCEQQKIKNTSSDDNCTGSEIIKHDITMTSTMIVPERDTPCSQWVSFNGDNEPVLNTSPEVDEGCDTFLKRLQRTKVINQNDPSLPSGQQFCFEAMVDKRYNRWKRRRRKKQSEARRTYVAQISDSSDENDERNTAMEKIIDKMYEEIHGPVPQTPNGSRDTPRSRNRRRRQGEDNAPKVQEDDYDIEEGSYTSLYDASSELTPDDPVPSSSSGDQVSQEQIIETNHTPVPEMPQPSGSASDDLCSWPYLERYKTEILKRLKSASSDQLEDMDQNDWLPEIRSPESSSSLIATQIKNIDTGEPGNSTCYVGSPDNNEYANNEHIKSHQDHVELDDLCIESKTEDMEEGEQTDVIVMPKEDSDVSSDDYKPIIRVEKAPCKSPIQTPDHVADFNVTNFQSQPRHKTVPDKQLYSYTRWSRSQRPDAKKSESVEQKPKLLARTNTTSWNETRYEQQNVLESTNTVSPRDRNIDPSDIVEGNIPATKFRLAKKVNTGQKVAMTIKKHNVNLPSLTKNSKSQTMADYGGRVSRDRPAKIKQRSTRIIAEERPRTQTPRISTPTKGSLKETHTVPEFLFKDYYMRSLYGNKTRINSHINVNKTDKALRKTLTVDNLELVAKQQKKKSDTPKSKELAFTRSFTFSMFDLPDMYKLYNTTLERRANGEEIETQE